MAAQNEPAIVDKNRHVKEYLAHYVSFPHAPGYAVLLNGPWGIGKTFLVKEFLKGHFEKMSDYVYVSLYGLSTISDFDIALFQAKYPALGWRITKLLKRAGRAAARFFNADLEVEVGEVLDKFNARLYVFDDIERCEAPVNTIMGYINEFVEHHECKVLIIANETEIPNQDDYRKRREKLIGKTLEVQSAFHEALTFFISQIDDDRTKSLFEAKTVEISSIYHQSELNNLRILQQTMWDFERLFSILTDKQRATDDAIVILLRLFFALSFELKAGRIQANDLTSRVDKIVDGMMAHHENAEPTPLMRADGRYPEVELHDTILSDELLGDILVKGVIDGSEIRAFLDRSPYFVVKGGEPPWQTVWHFVERTDEEFADAYERMEEQFAARDFTEIGEILHVFGLRLLLADIGVSNRSRADVAREAKEYVDDMYVQKTLQLLPVNEFEHFHFAGYGGLGIHQYDTAEYRELYTYMKETQTKAREDGYPAQAADLLKEMETDPELYFRRLNVTNSDDNIYYRVPVLASIEPDTFVSTLLNLHPAHQRIVMKAFKTRYENGRLGRELPEEGEWLVVVRDKLAEAAKALPPIGRYRLTRSIEWYIAPALKREERAPD